jgi:rare lipoprotein A (peptidoglycan hydrolase)
MHLHRTTARAALALALGLSIPALHAVTALGSTGGASAPTTPSASNAPASSASVRPTGVATWFGPGFYGNKTACGQTLTPTVIGVANRTLPCGTLIRVSYHGHALTVPVLDRGPYAHGADWDLTAGAAHALGVTETVRIHTRVVGTTANTPTLGTPPGSTPAPSPQATAAGGTSAG